EKYFRVSRGHGPGIDLRHVPAVELDPNVALDPGERVFLAYRDQHIVAGKMLLGLTGRNECAPPLGVVFRLDLLEQHAGQLAVDVGDLFRHEIIEDRDILVHGVFLFPRRRLHLLEARTHDHLDVLTAEPPRRAAAVHGGVATPEHDHTLADLVDVSER